MNNTNKKVAICMRGNIGDNIDYVKCYNSIKKHITELDRNIKDGYSFDFFCHSWNTTLQDEIISIYNPKKSLFEDNELYTDEINKKCKKRVHFSNISHSLTMKKSIELKEQYETENNFKYDIVILYRYDLFLWVNMPLRRYPINDNIITINAHYNFGGDFHFVMKNSLSSEFKNLYNAPEMGVEPRAHKWIKNYIIGKMKKKLKMDHIIPGKHQEVIRKIQEFSIKRGFLRLDVFNSY